MRVGLLANVMRSALPWPMKLTEASAQGLDFLFVGRFLALGKFQSLQNVFHIGECFFERGDNAVNFFDCVRDRGSGRWTG